MAVRCPQCRCVERYRVYQTGEELRLEPIQVLCLGFLATVRRDGGPRIHPVCPVVTGGGLYVFVIPSPKREDLLRDGRYALHTFPPVDRDDEFYVTGRARLIEDEASCAAAEEAYLATGATKGHQELLFELHLERALLATYRPRGEPASWPPTYTRWRAP